MRLLLTALIACGGTAPTSNFPVDDFSQPHAIAEVATPMPLVRKARVDYLMHAHYDDLRAVERLLIAGRLDDANTRAFLLAMPVEDPGLAGWPVERQRVVDTATSLRQACCLADALAREAQVAAACASCHVAADHPVRFAPIPPLPPDTGAPAARFARHGWAVERLWEGMIAPSDERWRAGLGALAITPLPSPSPSLAATLRGQARAELDVPQPEDRAAAYAALLVTCAACHANR